VELSTILLTTYTSNIQLLFVFVTPDVISLQLGTPKIVGGPVRERTIPTERLPLVGKVSANVCG
jgi:hypothetical protein